MPDNIIVVTVDIPTDILNVEIPALDVVNIDIPDDIVHVEIPG